MAQCPGCGSIVGDESECPHCGVWLNIGALKPGRVRKRPLLIIVAAIAVCLLLLLLAVGEGAIDNKKVNIKVVITNVNDGRSGSGTQDVRLDIRMEQHLTSRGSSVGHRPNLESFELRTDSGSVYTISTVRQSYIPYIEEDSFTFGMVWFTIPAGEKPELLMYHYGAYISTASCPDPRLI